MNRRTFIKQAAVTTGAASIASVVAANESRPGPQATAQEDTGHKSAMKPIEHLLLFIHTPVTYSYHKLLRPAPAIAANFRRLLASRASEATTAACIIQSGRGDQPLVEAGQEHFGDRCIVDPSDNKVELFNFSPNSLIQGEGSRSTKGMKRHEGAVMSWPDGCGGGKQGVFG